MPYRYLEGIAGGDVAFEATGTSREELFISAAEATMNVMVDELDTIHHTHEINFEVEHAELDILLFKFLNELIFFKDSKRFLTRIEKVTFGKRGSLFTLNARGYSEVLNPQMHPLHLDVKAVTLHRFRVSQTDKGWEAMVVLDV